ncbi:MAG: recombination-associated protein RdgC [Thiomargarita sp.]|nr:recombination-associated protein RdgC [Thiomargarita sp.]
MWFKNLHIFRFLKPIQINAEELNEKLSQINFYPCGKMDMESVGWVSPLGSNNDSLVHSANNCFVVTTRLEEKILPASVIREFVNEKAEEIEMQQMRKVGRKEKNNIREEVLHDLVPRAFSRSNYLSAYIDATNAWLIIDTPNRKKAESFASFLRQTIGSLPVTSPKMQKLPAQVMTQWLVNESECPPDFELGNACILSDKDHEGAIVNCKRQDLLAEEMQGHLEADKQVTRVALEWQDRLSFTLDDELVIRQLKPLDLIDSERDESGEETPEQRFDSDFAMMTLELANLIKRIFELFGGEDTAYYDKKG